MSCTPSKKLLLGLMSSFLVSAASLCGVCPPGHFVEKECTKTSNRICKPCPADTYMDIPNLRNKCHGCKTCIGNQVVSSACTATTNTQCECPRGYYFNTELFICFPCTPCKEGTGVYKECSVTSDTVCETCKEETYSNVRSLTQRCMKCRTCHAGEIVRLNCTREHDRECAASEKKTLITQNKSKMPTTDKEDQNFRPKPGNTSIKSEKPMVQTSTQKPTEKLYTAQNMVEVQSLAIEEIVMYVFVGLVLLVILAAVVGCCCWRRKHSTGQAISEGPVTGKPEKGTKREVVVEIDGDRPRSRVLLEEKSQDHHIRDVNYGLFDELNTYLNPKERWKKVAAKLNFSENDVANFELNTGNATIQMLSTWGHKRKAMLSVLLDVFVSLGWDTAAEIVARYMK